MSHFCVRQLAEYPLKSLGEIKICRNELDAPVRCRSQTKPLVDARCNRHITHADRIRNIRPQLTSEPHNAAAITSARHHPEREIPADSYSQPTLLSRSTEVYSAGKDALRT